MKFNEILEIMIKTNASDAFIRIDSPLRARINSYVEVVCENKFTVEDINSIVQEITEEREILAERSVLL